MFCVLQKEKKGSVLRAADRCRRKLEACELWLLTHKLSFTLELHSTSSKVPSCVILWIHISDTLINILLSLNRLVTETLQSFAVFLSSCRVTLFTCLLCMSWMSGEKLLTTAKPRVGGTSSF